MRFLRDVPILDIIPDFKYYPRDWVEDDTSLEKSISKYGILMPLSVDEKMVIIEGHKRFKYAKAYGIEKINVLVTQFKPVREYSYLEKLALCSKGINIDNIGLGNLCIAYKLMAIESKKSLFKMNPTYDVLELLNSFRVEDIVKISSFFNNNNNTLRYILKILKKANLNNNDIINTFKQFEDMYYKREKDLKEGFVRIKAGIALPPSVIFNYGKEVRLVLDVKDEDTLKRDLYKLIKLVDDKQFRSLLDICLRERL